MNLSIKTMFLLLALFAVSAWSNIAKSSSVNAKIEYVLPHSGDVVFLQMIGENATSLNAQGTNANCITVGTGNFVVELSSETGRAIYAALLTASAQDKPILVKGGDTCKYGREVVHWVLLR